MKSYNWDEKDGRPGGRPFRLSDIGEGQGIGFRFRDMVCTDCEWAAGYFYGLTEQPIGSVSIENVSFTFKEDAQSGRPAMMDYIDQECKRGLYFNCVKKVQLKNVTMSGQDGQRLITVNVDEVVDE